MVDFDPHLVLTIRLESIAFFNVVDNHSLQGSLAADTNNQLPPEDGIAL